MPRKTRNSQDAALIPGSTPTGAEPPSCSVALQGQQQPAANNIQALSPDVLASIVAAVKSALAAENTTSSTTVVQQAENPSASVPSEASGTVPSPAVIGSQTANLLASGIAVGPQLAQVIPSCSVAQGRSSVSVPSFVNTFATSVPNLSMASASNASNIVKTGIPQIPSLPAPVSQQPFVVGPGFSPIPAKTVAIIVAGKFVDFNELLSANISQQEPEPQLLFDGRVVLTSTVKKHKRRIEDIITWMEAFSSYALVLTSCFPNRWRNLAQYQLLIL